MERKGVCRQKRERERKGVSGGSGDLPPLNDYILRRYPSAEDPALPIHLEMEPDIADVELQRIAAEGRYPGFERLPAAEIEEGQLGSRFGPSCPAHCLFQ
jgi:hypothetical protein